MSAATDTRLASACWITDSRSHSGSYQIVLLYVAPLLTQNVMSGLTMASDMASRSFLQNAISAGNSTAITTAAAAPQSLGNVFGFFRYDVRPITAWAVSEVSLLEESRALTNGRLLLLILLQSAAPMEAGLIYNVIFTFHLVLFSAIARLSTGLQMKLTTGSLLKLRLAVPAFCYFWFSLFYTLVNRAFQEPFDNSVGSAGFVTFWALNYLTYLAVGLALEALMSLLTMRWFPFALIFWIILNITSSFLPIELMQPFYRWGRAWPFRLNVQATKLIIFNTEPPHLLGEYMGGEMAWAFAGVVAVIAFQLLDRWRMDRGAKAQMASKEGTQVDEEEVSGHGTTASNGKSLQPPNGQAPQTPQEEFYEAETPGAFDQESISTDVDR